MVKLSACVPLDATADISASSSTLPFTSGGVNAALANAGGVRQASMDELKDQLLTQLFAGHETTGTAIGRWMQPLQRRPDVVAALRDEQAGLIAQHGPDITGAHLPA